MSQAVLCSYEQKHAMYEDSFRFVQKVESNDQTPIAACDIKVGSDFCGLGKVDGFIIIERIDQYKWLLEITFERGPKAD